MKRRSVGPGEGRRSDLCVRVPLAVLRQSDNVAAVTTSDPFPGGLRLLVWDWQVARRRRLASRLVRLSPLDYRV